MAKLNTSSDIALQLLTSDYHQLININDDMAVSWQKI